MHDEFVAPRNQKDILEIRTYLIELDSRIDKSVELNL